MILKKIIQCNFYHPLIAGNIPKRIHIVQMLIGWLCRYEYFVNMKKDGMFTKHLSKRYFIYVVFGHF